MKKFLTALLTLAMMMSAAGCSSDTSADTEKQEETAEQTDSEYVKEKGTLVVGITDFAPMDYQEGGEWIGFDADMAKAFADTLGVEAVLFEIDWDNKIMELNGKSIDCVWNGMTLTEEVMNSMETSNAYCDNAQVVVKKADDEGVYQDAESMAGKNIAVESGSAAAEILDEMGVEYIACQNQAAALMEVAAGTSDLCVIDALMAGAMIGEGTDYPDLTADSPLNSEQYGVGFRKGSDLAGLLNEFLKASYEDGSMMETAEKYGVQVSIIKQ